MRSLREIWLVNRLGVALVIGGLLDAGNAWALPSGPSAWSAVDWWTHVDQLVERHAYPAVVEELRQAGARGDFAQRYADRLGYYRGYAERRLGNRSEALRALALVPSTSRWYPKALTESALLAREAGDDAQAIRLYERLLPVVGNDQRASTLASLADLYFVSGQFTRALVHYRDLAGAGGPFQERALFAWGWTLLRMGQEEAATNVWKEALERFPVSRHAQSVRLGLGNLLLSRGDHLAASTYYNEAARVQGPGGGKPDLTLMARAELLAGEAYADARDYTLAISHYQAVPVEDALIEPSRYGEAYCTWQLGQLRQAQQLFTDWIIRFPQSNYRGAAYYALGVIARDLGQDERALDAWQMVTSVAPASSYAEDARYQLILRSFKAGDYAGAISLGRQLEFNHPRGRWLGPLLWVRGESYVAMGLFQEAVQAYSQLANLGNLGFLAGQGDEVEFKIAMAHFYGGNYAEAARRFEAVDRGALVAQALFWQAEARYRLGELDSARALYGRLIARHSDFSRIPEAYYGLGWAAHRLNDLEGAKVAFTEAVRRLGDGRTRQDATFRLGLVLADLRDWEGARQVFNGLLGASVAPELAVEARFQVCWGLYRQGRLEEAASGFASFAANHASNRLAPQALIWQGRSLFRLNRYPESIDALRQATNHALASAAQLYEAREQLAAAHFNAGQFDDARRVYELLLQMGDLPAERTEALHQGILAAHLKSGNYRAARQELLKRGALSQDDWQSLLTVTDYFMNRAQWDEVIDTYRQVKSPPAMLKFAAGRALIEKRAFGEALRVLGEIREVPDQDLRPQVWHQLSRAYRGAGDLPRARELLLQLSEVYFARPLAWQALLEAAELAVSVGEHPAAQGYFRRVAENRAVSVDKRRLAWMGLGDSHRQTKQWGQALLAYRAAKGLGGNDALGSAIAAYWSGCVLVELKQFKEAVNELRDLRFPPQSEPLPALAALKLGECYEQMGRWGDAAALYGRLSGGAPAAERSEAVKRLEWLRAHVSVELKPQDAYNAAVALRDRGALAQARERFVQIADDYANKPIASQALLDASAIARRQKDLAGAVALLRRVGEGPAYPERHRLQAFMGLGDTYREGRQWSSALQAYRQSRGMGRDASVTAPAAYWCGYVLFELKQYPETIRELQGLNLPDRAEPWRSLIDLKCAEAMEQVSQWREAAQIYSRLTRTAPEQERKEAGARLNWIEQNIPKEMRS